MCGALPLTNQGHMSYATQIYKCEIFMWGVHTHNKSCLEHAAPWRSLASQLASATSDPLINTNMNLNMNIDINMSVNMNV